MFAFTDVDFGVICQHLEIPVGVGVLVLLSVLPCRFRYHLLVFTVGCICRMVEISFSCVGSCTILLHTSQSHAPLKVPLCCTDKLLKANVVQTQFSLWIDSKIYRIDTVIVESNHNPLFVNGKVNQRAHLSKLAKQRTIMVQIKCQLQQKKQC